MNYAWIRADRLERTNIIYQSRGDRTIQWIDEAGDLHLRLHFDWNIAIQHIEAETMVVRRDQYVMVQVCHRRHYETSQHHKPIDQGKALLKLIRKRFRPRVSNDE